MSQEPTIHDKLYVQPDQFEIPTRCRVNWTNPKTGETHTSPWYDNFTNVDYYINLGRLLGLKYEIEYEK